MIKVKSRIEPLALSLDEHISIILIYVLPDFGNGAIRVKLILDYCYSATLRLLRYVTGIVASGREGVYIYVLMTLIQIESLHGLHVLGIHQVGQVAVLLRLYQLTETIGISHVVIAIANILLLLFNQELYRIFHISVLFRFIVNFFKFISCFETFFVKDLRRNLIMHRLHRLCSIIDIWYSYFLFDNPFNYFPLILFSRWIAFRPFNDCLNTSCFLFS